METKNKKMSNVPNLRFKGFKGEWEKKKLGEVAEIVGGGTPDTNVEEYWNGDIQWFTPTEIKSNFVSKSNRTITELGLKNSSAKLLPIGAILLTTRATIGDASVTLVECCTNQGFQSLIVNKKYSNTFIINWIEQNKREFIKRSKGSTFPEISKKEVEQIQVFMPILPEQTKIASFLSLIDERIDTQMKTIQSLESLMRGVREKIFSQNLRFRGENGNGNEWLKDIVDNLFFLQDGYAFSSNDFTDIDINSKQVIRITDINNKNKNAEKIYVTNKIIKKLELEKYKVEKGDLLLSLTGAAGFNFFIWDSDDAYINQRTMKISSKNQKNKYLTILLESLIHAKINSIGTGQNNNLSKDALKKIELVFPCSKLQTTIASFLSSLDQKIETEKEILTQYQNQKKYLLQNLFV